MEELEPLRFQPLFKRYVWGGRNLGDRLGKPIGKGSDYAESWEVVDHGQDQSVVALGPLAGLTLSEVVRRWPNEVLGRAAGLLDKATHPGFPLLFKFLDAQQNLSVQVHPNDQQAASLSPPDLGKTEAWVILAALPDATVYAGLKSGVDRQTLERHVAAGTTEECLHQFHPSPGDCIFIPAGTVHALGAGLLVAEIQQSSNTTYRLSDWNRLDAAGNPRTLHVKQALDTIDFSRGPVHPQVPTLIEGTHREFLVQCDRFILERWRWNLRVELPRDDRCHILTLIEGHVQIRQGSKTWLLRSGDTIMMTASRAATELVAEDAAEVLDMYLPT